MHLLNTYYSVIWLVVQCAKSKKSDYSPSIVYHNIRVLSSCPTSIIPVVGTIKLMPSLNHDLLFKLIFYKIYY